MNFYDVIMSIDSDLTKAMSDATKQVNELTGLKPGADMRFLFVTAIVLKHPTLIDRLVPGHCVTAVVVSKIPSRYPESE